VGIGCAGAADFGEDELSHTGKLICKRAYRFHDEKLAMKTTLALILYVFIPAFLMADDLVTASPKGAFKIVQHYDEKEGWSEMLHFADKSQPDVTLEGEISWPGNYYIAPDGRWILRIQKTGSGDNTSYIYFLENNGSVWRMEQPLGDMGFDFLRHQPKGLPTGMYHSGIEFISWDMPNHLLHFSVHSSSDPGTGGVHQDLTYRLLENRIVSP
jgi:hypothetical protein